MRKIKLWIVDKPIISFFLLGIIVCFSTLFPAVSLVSQKNEIRQILGFFLAKIAVYSPVLTGMFVAGTVRPCRQRVSLARRLAVFLPVWLIAVVVHTASLKLTAQSELSLTICVILSLPVAILPALVMTSAVAGKDGVRDMLASLIKPKGHIVYYLIALLIFPFIHIAGTGITNTLNGDPWFPRIAEEADLAYTIFVSFFSVLLFSGGINEEAGWRGFAQKRLQLYYSPLVTNLIMWVLLVIWHIPNDIVQYQHGGYILVRLGLYPFILILFGWLFNRAEGSILVPAIFHASMNTMNPLMEYFPITIAGSILLVGFVLAVVISDRMWRKLPDNHKALFTPPGEVRADTDS